MSNDRQTCADQILKAIDYGKLPADETEARLQQIIRDELSCAEQSEIGKTRVELCNSLLLQLYTHGEVQGLSADDEEMKARIEKGYTRRRRRKRLLTRAMISLTAAVVLLVGLTAAGVISPYRWFTGESTEDEQQYILQGHEISIQTISEAIAEHERRNDVDSLQTSDNSEVIDFLGFDPHIPVSLSNRYFACLYEVLFSQSHIKVCCDYSIDGIPRNPAPIYIVIRYYDDLEMAYLSFEQDEEGETISICGVEVYRFTNYNREGYIWIQGNQIISLYCLESQEIAEKCVEEMIRYLKGK